MTAKAMSPLLLALALAASAAAAERREAPGRAAPTEMCAVSARVLDAGGGTAPARAVSAGRAPVVVLSGRLLHDPAGRSPLVFDVFNPAGQRYQTLDTRLRVETIVRSGPGLSRRTRVRRHEARLAVAGSSIAWTSMYGTWRVVPRFEGDESPCGRAVSFTIGP